MNHDIKIKSISLDGGQCAQPVFVTVDGVEYDFGDHCLKSGGDAYLDDDWEPMVTKDPWSVRFPEGFPEELKEDVLREISTEIPWGAVEDACKMV